MTLVQRDVMRDDGQRLRAWRGGGGAIDFLLVPGFFGDIDVFAAIEPTLAKLGGLHAWDLRGLDGPGGPAEIETHALDGWAVLDDAGVRDVVLVGYCAGAPIALEMARVAPERVRGFVSIAGVFGGPIERILRRFVGPAADTVPLALGASAFAGRGHKLPTWLADTLRSRWTMASLRMLGLVGEHADPRPLEEVLVRTLARDAGAIAGAWAALAEYLVEGPRAEVTVPSLWIAGGRDPLAGPMVARLAAAAGNDATVRVVRGGGHLLPVEQAELLSLWIEDFLHDKGLTAAA